MQAGFSIGDLLFLKLENISRKYLVTVTSYLAQSRRELIGKGIEHIAIYRDRLLHEPANAVSIAKHSDHCLITLNAYFNFLIFGDRRRPFRLNLMVRCHIRK